MNYFKEFFLLLMLPVFGQYALGQAENPQIIPVSPEAAALAKMVNYPVNYNTGVPDINIPLYEINVGGMTLPVTLQYHSGGFRINEQSTRSGLGWSLSSDLQITRTINGKDDFLTNGYIGNDKVRAFYPNYSTCTSCAYPMTGQEGYMLANGEKDGAPDKFTYKLLGKSGSFYFQKNNAGTGYTIVPVPFDNIKIQYADGAFTITDTDGTTYYFGETGTGDINQLLAKGIEVSGSVDWGGNCGGGDCSRSAWKCKRIVNNAGTDEITFTYANKAVAKYHTYNDYVEYYNNENPCNLSWGGYYTSNKSPMNNPTLTYQTLTGSVPFHRISSPKYMVYFGNNPKAYFHVPYLNGTSVVDRVYEWNRSLFSTSTNVAGLSVSEISFRGGKVQFNGADKLNYIRVLDGNNTEVKSFHFFHSYTNAVYATESKFYNGPDFLGTMYLDSLHVRNGTTTYDRYALFYENKFCYGNHLKGHDAWGYPNANTVEIAANMMGNVLSLPTMDIVQPRFYRDVDGGCTNFAANVPVTIGGNDWAEASHKTAMKRGILRRIVYPTGGYTDFDFEPNQYEEEFVGPFHHNFLPQLSGGLRIRAINNYDENGTHKGQLYYRYGMKEEGNGILVNRPNRTLENGKFHYGAVSYEQEQVYLQTAGGFQTCSSTNCLSVLAIEKKTTYQPASALDYTYSHGAPIYYQKVTEYTQDLGEHHGKTVYEYYEPGKFYDNFSAPLYRDNRIFNTNMPYLKTDGLMGMQKSVTSYKPQGRFGYIPVHKKEYEYQRYLRDAQIRVSYMFMRVLYSVVEGNYTGTTVGLYTGSGFAASPHYPGPNYVSGEYGIPSGRMLVNKITETSYETGDSIKTVSEFAYGKLPYLQPSSVTTTDSKGQQTNRVMRYAYDFTSTPVYATMVGKNMISQLIEEVETNTAFNMEVARKRTDYAQFAVGFNPILPATQQSSVKGQPLTTDVTFNEYDQYGNILQYTGRDGVPVSYLWGYQSQYPVAELKGVAYASIPSSYKSNAQVNNPASDGALQTFLGGLRSTFSVEKLISTYAYKRLVGLTSKAASNGQMVYYDYDPVGRLTAEKDHNQHVVNQYDYQMRGPAIPVWNAVTYTNVPVMRSHSVECSPGIRQFYNRIVPGGSYLESIDQGNADNGARQNAEMVSPPLDLPACPPTSGLVPVQLSYSITATVANPTQVEMDFIQDGAVVATYRFYAESLPVNQRTVYVPAGSYQMSVRISADVNYNKGAVVYNFSGGQYFGITYDRNQTYVLQSGASYAFTISTIIII